MSSSTGSSAVAPAVKPRVILVAGHATDEQLHAALTVEEIANIPLPHKPNVAVAVEKSGIVVVTRSPALAGLLDQACSNGGRSKWERHEGCNCTCQLQKFVLPVRNATPARASRELHAIFST